MNSWNALIANLPNAHLLQTWEWGQTKARYGWKPIPLILDEARGWLPAEEIRQRPASAASLGAVLLLERSLSAGGLSLPVRVLYAPKGPLLDWDNAALRHAALEGLQRVARQRRAIFIKIDPNVSLGTGFPGQPDANEDPLGQALAAELRARGWRYSGEQIQFRNTMIIDLRPSEEELLAAMKQKTRYNIRLAERKGVTVRPGSLDDLPMLYQMYAETSIRDGFVIRDEDYYRNVWETFMRAAADGSSGQPIAEPLIAEGAGEAVAAVVIFRFAGQAWYIHGMSRQAQREKMPNYLLQWEAMRRAKAAGCERYDLWGAPDTFESDDPMWGVYRFKEGLGGIVERSIGAWDYPVSPALYRLYTQILPRLLEIMRRRGRQQTRRSLGTSV
jgi:peptidoglycan pentaglycine glycine transferase (the first glycine)